MKDEELGRQKDSPGQENCRGIGWEARGLPGGPVSPGEALVGVNAGGLWRDRLPLSHTLKLLGDKDCLPAQKLGE